MRLFFKLNKQTLINVFLSIFGMILFHLLDEFHNELFGANLYKILSSLIYLLNSRTPFDKIILLSFNLK